MPGSKSSPVYIGIFLISMATLVLEISLTRIFSVSQWYHFAFMVVSIALFGFGASGSFLAVFPSMLRKNINGLLVVFSGIFSLSCVVSFIATNQIPFDPFRIAWDSRQVFYIMVYYIMLGIPFFASGICIAIALTELSKKVSVVYFFNLIGAGAGSMLVIALFSPLGGVGAVIFASLLGGLSVISFSLKYNRKVMVIALVWVLVTLSLLVSAPPQLHINISQYKSLSTTLTRPESKVLHTEWNSFSRIDVVESKFIRFAPGLSYEYTGIIPPQMGITTDGNNMDAITYCRNIAEAGFTDYLPSSLAYLLKEEEKVLIINPGGGLDVLTALYHNASYIKAIEVNPIVVDVVRDRYRDYSCRIYNDDRVDIEIGEGRSFVRGDDEEYDIIQMSMADNLAASSTGVYALSENYLYTTEAFEDYYNHLSDGGVLSITRWLLPPPREGIRIVSLGISALEKLGVKHPENHMAVIRSLETITVLIKNGEFTGEEIEKIRNFSRERKFDLVYIKGINREEVNIYNEFPEPYYYLFIQQLISKEERTRFYEDYLFNVGPVSDERPFFFHFFKWDKLIPLYESMGKKWQPFVEGSYLVPVVFVQALILSTIFILLPVYTFKKLDYEIKGRTRALAYFLCLGIGFMFIEIAMIQKFILFLGHPVHAISVVISSLLVFSGIGSLTTGRFKDRVESLIPVILFLSAFILLYLLFLPKVFHAFLGVLLVGRVLISIVILAPLGFIMGMPFPMGIKLLDRIGHDLIPWAWAVNGCASVLASILAIVIALSSGFSVVLLLSSATYLVGLGMMLSLRENRKSCL